MAGWLERSIRPRRLEGVEEVVVAAHLRRVVCLGVECPMRYVMSSRKEAVLVAVVEAAGEQAPEHVVEVAAL